MADGLGFEPRQTAPEAAVLPLHYPSVQDQRYYTIRAAISTFFLDLGPLVLKRYYAVKNPFSAGAGYGIKIKISQALKLIPRPRHSVF